MHAAPALARLGGVAGRRSLLRLTSPRQLRRAVRRGHVVRVSRGRYALPAAQDARVRAAAVGGVVCLRSAAADHGWELKVQAERPEIAVNPRRHVAAERREGVRLLWTNVSADDQQAGVTGPLRTVVDCARHLPFDEALAIADSALRSRKVGADELASIRVQGRGAVAVRRVLGHADARSANPFESVLRALCIEVGLEVEPQGAIDLGTGTIHSDLVARPTGLALEADSWTFHAGRKEHARDCARYNLLVIRGWRVLRFTWEHVMHEQSYVRWVLRELLDVETQRRVGQDKVDDGLPRSA